MKISRGEIVANTWIAAAEKPDPITLFGLIADDIVLRPPFIEGEIHGIANVAATFITFSMVTQNFRYGRSWSTDHEVVLEFMAEIGDETIHAFDLIKLDENGKIISFEVVGRSPSGVKALGDAVEQRAWYRKVGSKLAGNLLAAWIKLFKVNKRKPLPLNNEFLPQ